MIFNRTYLGYESPTPDYLCFTSTSAFSVGMVSSSSGGTSVSLEYSKDKTTWDTFVPGTTTVSASADENVYLRGDNSYFNNNPAYWMFSFTGTGIRASGNIMSLLDKTCERSDVPTYGFNFLFKNCTSLVSAPDLPATYLNDYAYMLMFWGCTSLVQAPRILVERVNGAGTVFGCNLRGMFRDCTSLVTMPKLKLRSVQSNIYENMFYNCSSLKVYTESGEGHDKAWNLPCDGTFSGLIDEYNTKNMFYGVQGDAPVSPTAASGTTLTFYTQNEPV